MTDRDDVGRESGTCSQRARKKRLADEVLRPLGARFSRRALERTALDGRTCLDTHAWFMTVRNGLVARATAFLDIIAFNDLRTPVTPALVPTSSERKKR